MYERTYCPVTKATDQKFMQSSGKCPVSCCYHVPCNVNQWLIHIAGEYYDNLNHITCTYM